MSEKLSHATCKNTDGLRFKRYFTEETNQLIGLCCQECLSEWVLPEFVDHTNKEEETIIISGKEYKLMQKKDLEESQLRIPKHRTEFSDHAATEESLKKGDHIYYKTYKGLIMHHAIILKKEINDKSKVQFTLVQWKRLDGNEFEIVKENVDLSAKTERVYRCDYPEDFAKADSVELTIARATALIGQKNYSLLSNNCEHFAIFCKVGCTKSFQQDVIKKKVTHILQEVCSFGVTVGTGICKKVIASAAANAAGDFAEFRATHGGKHLFTVSTQSIGLGVVAAINGIIYVFDIGKAYKQYRGGKLTISEFKDSIWRKFITRIERIFFTGVFPAACAVGFGIVVTNPATWATITFVVVGAIVGGCLATAVEGFGQTKLGRTLSFTLRPILDHSDKSVESISELREGDHVVVSRWALHPRCHIIIVDIKEKEQNMLAIRFTYQKGIVKQLVPFKKPVYKVMYEDWECFPPKDVVRRAAEKKKEQRLQYSISCNNCKSFARWCKTGKGPKSLFAVKGYEEDGDEDDREENYISDESDNDNNYDNEENV